VLAGQGLGRGARGRQRVGQPDDLGCRQLPQQRTGQYVRPGDDRGVTLDDLPGVAGRRAGDVAAQHRQLCEPALGLLKSGRRRRVQIPVGEPVAGLLPGGVGAPDGLLHRAAVAEALLCDEQRCPVSLHPQRVRRVRDAAAELEHPVRRTQIGRRLRLVRDAEHTEHDREQCGHQPDGDELPDQRPVARAQAVRPRGSGLGAGHAHVPQLL